MFFWKFIFCLLKIDICRVIEYFHQGFFKCFGSAPCVKREEHGWQYKHVEQPGNQQRERDQESKSLGAAERGEHENPEAEKEYGRGVDHAVAGFFQCRDH